MHLRAFVQPERVSRGLGVSLVSCISEYLWSLRLHVITMAGNGPSLNQLLKRWLVDEIGSTSC